MAIKSKELSKFYIEQIILEDNNNPGNWTEPQFQSICRHDKLIGFLFSVKNGVKFGEPIKVLNLYLIKPLYYKKEDISLDCLKVAWLEFIAKMATEKQYTKMIVFKNPPIEQWMDTKENWCKKQAAKVAEQFNWSFDEALSEVYYTIMKCYSKEHVYMGNLGYIQTSIYNNVRMCIRFNKNRLNQASGRCTSLDQTIMESDDGEEITLADCIGEDDSHYIKVEYEDFERDCKALLSKSFSPREIDQILTQKAGYLPMNLYRRLVSWRKQHSPAELE